MGKVAKTVAVVLTLSASLGAQASLRSELTKLLRQSDSLVKMLRPKSRRKGPALSTLRLASKRGDRLAVRLDRLVKRHAKNAFAARAAGVIRKRILAPRVRAELRLAQHYGRREDWPRAIKHLKRALKLDPKNKSARVAKADAEKRAKSSRAGRALIGNPFTIGPIVGGG